MLVLAPAACILSGIALSSAFDVLTRSMNCQLSKLFDDGPAIVRLFHLYLLHCLNWITKCLVEQVIEYFFLLKLKSGNGSPNGSSASTVNTSSSKSEKTEKSEAAPKEKPSKKNRKKDREVTESASVKPKKEKRLSVLPLEASIVGTLLLIALGGFYVVSSLPLVSCQKECLYT